MTPYAVPLIDVYCDESCHLEKDQQSHMVLGALWLPAAKAREVADRLRDLKAQHNLPKGFELKWSKVGAKKAAYYHDVLDYFFDDDDLKLRVLIASKAGLSHADFAQEHDDWYYKMYFLLLRWLLQRGFGTYRIYLDQKDTQGAAKVKRLHEILCSSQGDFTQRILTRMHTVRSHDVEPIQLTDFLIGGISYAARELSSSQTKSALVKRLSERAKTSLVRSTSLNSSKVNVFLWEAQKA